MPTRAPADVTAGLVGDGPGIRLGGRARFEGDRLWLVDALGRCVVELAAGERPPREGALLVLEGALERGTLSSARVHWVDEGARPGADVSRLSDRGVGLRLAARAAAADAVRAWLRGEGFLEVETPARVPCPGLDLHLEAFAVQSGDAPRWLATSPELQMKRLLVGGVPRCFQLARSFRRGERGDRHEPEFTMLEWYRAFAEMEEVVRDTEALCELVARTIGREGELSVEGRRVSLERPFVRVTVAQAFRDHAGIDEEETLRLASEDEPSFFDVLVTKVEPALAALPRAVVLHRYPTPFASLARRADDDPRWAERFEVYAGGLELCNGFGELTDPAEQRARFEHDRAERASSGRDVYPIDERFLSALAEGMPPSAGNALGFDRLVAAALGERRIADVLAVPDAEL